MSTPSPYVIIPQSHIVVAITTSHGRPTTVVMSAADEQGMTRADLVKNTVGVAAAVSAIAPLVGAPKAAEAKGPAWVQVWQRVAHISSKTMEQRCNDTMQSHHHKC